MAQVVLKYEWLEDCLKVGHSLPAEPYLLVNVSKSHLLALDESNPKAIIPEGNKPLEGSSMESNEGSDARLNEEECEADESSYKRRKMDDWMSIIQKGAKLGVVGTRGITTDIHEVNDEKSQNPATPRIASFGTSMLANFATQELAEPVQEPTSTYTPPNLNQNITDIFAELKSILGDALGDDRRSFSYHKANSVLEKLPFKVTSVDQVKGLPSIGKSMQDHIAEILKTGTLAKLKHFKEDEKVRAVSQFGSVWGIGPLTARKLYDKGHRTLEDLMSEETLNSAQKIGLKFHSDINTKIPRHEVQEMEVLVQKFAESIETKVIVVCGGSYRRGKAFVGDIDIIFTHPDGKSHTGFLLKLVQMLKDVDFLAEDLRMDYHPKETERRVDTYFGLCKFPGREQRHRIDFKVYPYEQYPYGLIAWTGNDVLNRRLRILADSKGFKLDDQGCFPVMKDEEGNQVVNRSCSAPCRTEREVFDFLGFPWLEPHERNL